MGSGVFSWVRAIDILTAKARLASRIGFRSSIVAMSHPGVQKTGLRLGPSSS
jgi:hypothetical protein